MNLKPVPLLTKVGESVFKSVDPVKTQVLFERITKNAEEKGMMVNHAKTGLLCVSGAVSYAPRAHLASGGQVERQTLKVPTRLNS